MADDVEIPSQDEEDPLVKMSSSATDTKTNIVANKSRAERHNYFTSMRALTMLLVVAEHIAVLYTHYPNASTRHYYRFYFGFLQNQSPLFFMLSGALLLPKNESLKDIFYIRLRRILVPLLAWTWIYSVFRIHIFKDDVSDDSKIQDDTDEYFLMQPEGQFWFLPALFSIYVLLPLYRVFFQNATNSVLGYILFVWFISHALEFPFGKTHQNKLQDQTLAKVLHTWTQLNSRVFTGFIGYFLSGAFIHKIWKESPSGPCITLGGRMIKRVYVGVGGLLVYLVGGATISILTEKNAWRREEGVDMVNPDRYADFLDPLVIIQSFGAFVFMLRAGDGIYRVCPRIVSSLTDCSYGIYLVHWLLLRSTLSRTKLHKQLPMFVFLTGATFFITCLAWLIIWTMRKTRLGRQIT